LNNKDKICSVRSEECEDADIIIVSYGAPVRSAVEAVRKAREDNKKVGYVKIDTPWPFPDEQLKEITKNALPEGIGDGPEYKAVKPIKNGRKNYRYSRKPVGKGKPYTKRSNNRKTEATTTAPKQDRRKNKAEKAKGKE
jgi:hypothetical protein